MTKTVCDFCESDVDKNQHYMLTLKKDHPVIAVEFDKIDLCGYCANRVRRLKEREAKPLVEKR